MFLRNVGKHLPDYRPSNFHVGGFERAGLRGKDISGIVVGIPGGPCLQAVARGKKRMSATHVESLSNKVLKKTDKTSCTFLI
jgi:hypothetical protein